MQLPSLSQLNAFRNISRQRLPQRLHYHSFQSSSGGTCTLWLTECPVLLEVWQSLAGVVLFTLFFQGWGMCLWYRCCLLVPFFGSVKPPTPAWCLKSALALCDAPRTGKEMLQSRCEHQQRCWCAAGLPAPPKHLTSSLDKCTILLKRGAWIQAGWQTPV